MSSNLLLKFELLYLLFTDGNIKTFIESLDLDQLLVTHRFLSEKTIELGIKIKGKSFPQEVITERLKTIAKSQSNHNCPSLHTACNIYECVDKRPDCARKMAIKQIPAIFSLAKELIFKS